MEQLEIHSKVERASCLPSMVIPLADHSQVISCALGQCQRRAHHFVEYTATKEIHQFWHFQTPGCRQSSHAEASHFHLWAGALGHTAVASRSHPTGSIHFAPCFLNGGHGKAEEYRTEVHIMAWDLRGQQGVDRDI